MDFLEQAASSLRHVQASNYLSVASTALVVYDYLITFDDEVRLVWPSKWNIGKIMFLLTRYPIFVDCAVNLVLALQPNLAFHLCQPLYAAASWMCFLGITIAEVIMSMRTYAIWGRNKYAGAFLVIMNLGIFIPTCILLQRIMKSLVFIPSPAPRLAPCVLFSADLIVFALYAMIMAQEAVILAMTFYKGFTAWRETRSPLVRMFLADGLQYFVIMFSVSLANVLVFKLANVDFSGLLLLLQRVLHAMLTGRILLEMREAVNKGSDNGPSKSKVGGGVSKVSTMNFAAGNGKNTKGSGDGLSLGGAGTRSESALYDDEYMDGVTSSGDTAAGDLAQVAFTEDDSIHSGAEKFPGKGKEKEDIV